MLTNYIEAAMRHAEIEDLGDEGWYAHIPRFPGLWGGGATEEEARKDLRSALESWILIGLRLGHQMPVVDDIDLTVKDVA